MMNDERRDQYMLEILDRLARLETKFDESVDVKHTAREALDKSNNNEQAILDLERRMDENDKKWQTDRTEKWGMWIAILAGIFTVGATLLGALIK
jgi:RecB family exonuclease